MKLSKISFLAIAALLLLSTAAWAAKADGLNEAMMGENIRGGFGDFSIDAKETFTTQSREVIWFASFKGFIYTGPRPKRQFGDRLAVYRTQSQAA